MAASSEQPSLSGDVQATKILFRDVQNASELREMAMKGRLECALVKASMVLDEFQLDVAVNKSLHNQAAKKMITRTVFTEILYALSPTKNITESLKRFGVGDDDHELVAIVLDESKVSEVESVVKGQRCSLDEVGQFSSTDVIKKLFKVTEQELRISTLLDSVVTRMAMKDIA